MYFSKSKYTRLRSCPKVLWLDENRPDLRPDDENTRARFEAGNEVGALARGLFGPYVDVTALKENGDLDLARMIENTKREMEAGTPVICEASFSWQGLYCAVDLLRKEGDGWAVYEVKSSTDSVQEKYFHDTGYQKYVLELCGVPLTGVYLVCLNNKYVFDGTLNLQELFRIYDMQEAAAAERINIPDALALAERTLASDTEPETELGALCPDCDYWPWCSRNLPKPNVFDLYRLNKDKKAEYYQKGLITFEALRDSGLIKNAAQRRQIEYATEEKGTWIEKEKIRAFLSTLTFPLYFLDFESMQPAVPLYVGTRPYAQIPFQYSLHYVEQEGGELRHREFLAESGTDPRRAIAEALCRDIPEDACVLAYNKAFECTRLKELAAMFPDLSEHLTGIAEHVIDLITPFQSGYYYNRAMGGSFSIKSVLPAIYPDDPELDYHNLAGVHNGGEAMSVFPKMQFMDPEEREVTRRNLLKYCELDTYALVKVWEELRRAAQMNEG